jgi:hypothetical protein
MVLMVYSSGDVFSWVILEHQEVSIVQCIPRHEWALTSTVDLAHNFPTKQGSFIIVIKKESIASSLQVFTTGQR